jgi:6-phosphogluconolactonase (cycloisomerase 2 family)
MKTGLRAAAVVLVTLFAAPAARGFVAMPLVQTAHDGIGGVDGMHVPFGVALSPDGANVYVASNIDDAVAVFSRDPGTGLVTFVEARFNGSGGITGMEFPVSVVVSPDGAHVYVGCRYDFGNGYHAMVVFSRDPGTGALSFVSADTASSGAVDLAMSADGAQLYALSRDELVVYARDAGSGALTAVDVEQDGVDGVQGFHQGVGLVLSPDGANLYVVTRTNSLDGSLLVFDRDPGTGALTFVEVLQHGDRHVEGLRGLRAVAISPEGAHVYVAGGQSRIGIFARDPLDGRLTALPAQKGLGADGLHLAVTPDGSRVLASGAFHLLSIFDRDPVTGGLTLAHVHLGGFIGEPRDFVLDSTGTHAYMADRDDDDLRVFRTTSYDCTPAPVAGCARAQAGRSQLTIRDDALRDRRDVVKWQWRGTAAGGGPPYAFCLYDAAGGAQPRLAAGVPDDGGCSQRRRGVPSACWSTSSNGTLRFKSRGIRPDGIETIVLRPGVSDDARISVVGKGERLAMPTLPLAPPVLVQLQPVGSGACFEAVFDASVSLNDGTRFKARSD